MPRDCARKTDDGAAGCLPSVWQSTSSVRRTWLWALQLRSHCRRRAPWVRSAVEPALERLVRAVGCGSAVRRCGTWARMSAIEPVELTRRPMEWTGAQVAVECARARAVGEVESRERSRTRRPSVAIVGIGAVRRIVVASRDGSYSSRTAAAV